jgi:hypothetical protein
MLICFRKKQENRFVSRNFKTFHSHSNIFAFFEDEQKGVKYQKIKHEANKKKIPKRTWKVCKRKSLNAQISNFKRKIENKNKTF